MFCSEGYVESSGSLFYGFSLLYTAPPVSLSLSLSLSLCVADILSYKGEVDLQDCDGSLQSSSNPVQVS